VLPHLVQLVGGAVILAGVVTVKLGEPAVVRPQGGSVDTAVRD